MTPPIVYNLKLMSSDDLNRDHEEVKQELEKCGLKVINEEDIVSELKVRIIFSTKQQNRSQL